MVPQGLEVFVDPTSLTRDPSARDPVTGLPSQLEMESLLNQRAIHQQSFALLVVALPTLARINNTFGRHVGDLVSATTGARLAAAAPDAMVAPLSGGSFGVGIPHSLSEADLEARVSRVLELSTREIRIGTVSLQVPVVVGSILTAPGTGALPALGDAEIAVQVAARRGVKHLRFSADLRRDTRDTFVLSSDLDKAIEDGQLMLHFQPQIELESGDLVGVEGLARWRHPTRGLLMPQQFLEIIELAGLLQAFTMQMLHQGVAAARVLRRARPRASTSINVPLTVLRDGQVVQDLLEELSRAGVEPGDLVLEITESSFEDPTIDPGELIAMLRGAGLGVALDDFGTGYSSFSRLADLDVTEIKIDRSFVSDLEREESRHHAIVPSVVELAGRLGVSVVAEGVEKPSQRECLVRYGCPVGQGYLLGRPMPLGDLLNQFPR